jgi:EAL domain-containing protein (putative c-di-GMP-specific phosphodiesterase class I)/GGDEF domain-containing protein
MRELWLYDFMTRSGVRNYRAKIMVMAFLGTHIPLIALVGYVTLQNTAGWDECLATLTVTLIATLVGTAITLWVLNHLLRPVLMTSRTLQAYRLTRETGTLPTHYRDEAGTLMADAAHTLAHLECALATLEYVDATTGLPNRKRLAADLARRCAIPSGGRFAACAIRFGQYTRLVEAFDLKVAEAAALAIAHRLQAGCREAPLYRVSGAEFLLLIDGLAEGKSALDTCGDVLRTLTASCGAPLAAADLTIEPILYAGVALWPDDAEAADPLIDHALAAVALASDDTRIRFHSAAARREAVGRLQLEAELRRALAHDEFVLHYQPVVDLALGQAIGAEALIRWQHPERGLLLPSAFINAAEATGLIDPIGLWVMRRTCLQIRDWNAAGLSGIRVAVNLSARQFLDRSLVASVDEAVRASGISADQLEIELTETAAMADHDHTRAVFAKLRDLGVSIAIDDFGTGFASMSYLRKLPFDKLKIDREFITNVDRTPDSQAICAALISLAKGLGLKILAEGTETPEEIAHLWSRGCSLYQGFYFSRPLAPAGFRAGLQAAAAASQAFAPRNLAEQLAHAG